jgi:hypothetical protein
MKNIDKQMNELESKNSNIINNTEITATKSNRNVKGQTKHKKSATALRKICAPTITTRRSRHRILTRGAAQTSDSSARAEDSRGVNK